MRPNSLALRLVASSAAVAAVLLLASAILLNSLFQQALERNFDARLRAVLDGLAANVDLQEDGSPRLSSQLADTRFELPLSGWYWQVTPPPTANAMPLASPSLLEKRLEIPGGLRINRDAEGKASFNLTDSEGNNLRVLSQQLELFGNKGYEFTVAGNFDELKNEVQAFRRILYLMLALLGLGLLAATFAQVRFGLKPMQDMRQRLNEIRSGKAQFLKGTFPREMQPLADEMNLVIKAGFEILERARTQVGNLAHALKTPLSVLTNEAATEASPLAAKVREQTDVMREQINLYLDRARRAAAAQSIGTVTEVEPILAALLRTLQRIHSEKGLSLTMQCDPELRFRGEKQDLEEMLGNLLDNACKWARSRVHVEARLDPSASRASLCVVVDDDGPGIPAEKRSLAMRRGQRLDETKPGSGLGLNIVTETAGMYAGKLELSQAELGGLRCKLTLPAVN